MEKKAVKKKLSRCDLKKLNWNDLFTLIAVVVSIASLYGLIQTNKQIDQAKELNDKQVAIDAVDKTKSEVYLKAVSRVNAVIANIAERVDKGKLEESLELYYGEKSIWKNLVLLRLDIELILGVYDYINLLYSNKLADRDVIRRGVYGSVRQVHKAVNKILPLYPELDNRSIEELLTNFLRLDGVVEQKLRKETDEKFAEYLSK